MCSNAAGTVGEVVEAVLTKVKVALKVVEVVLSLC